MDRKACLDENELAAFLGSPNDSPLRDHVREHVDRCPMCRALLANFIGTLETPHDLSAEQPPAEKTSRTVACADETASFEPGQVLAGRLELERIIGRGGTSVVWAGFDHARRSPVALKILTRIEPQLRQRMLREARIMQLLVHPAILQVREVLELGDGGPLVLLSELLVGRTLGAHCRSNSPLSVDATRDIFRPIMDGVVFAHRLGIVHRDLKPDNVFLAQQGIKILDFGMVGLTAAEGAAKASVALTESGMLMGTARYMALEQLHAEKDIDARADVWALGLMLYEALAGEPAITADSFAGVLRIVSQGGIAPLGDRRPRLPARVTSLVDSMLVRDRARRPGNVASLLASMEQW